MGPVGSVGPVWSSLSELFRGFGSLAGVGVEFGVAGSSSFATVSGFAGWVRDSCSARGAEGAVSGMEVPVAMDMVHPCLAKQDGEEDERRWSHFAALFLAAIG